MKHPLENYRVIADPNFIFQLEQKFYNEYYEELSLNFIVVLEKDKDRMRVILDDDESSDNNYIVFSSYFFSQYDKLEKEVRSVLDNNLTFLNLEENKQQLFIKRIIAELQVLHIAIKKNEIDTKYEFYKSKLLDRCKMLSETIESVYMLQQINHYSSVPKIKWLGNVNQLGSLFYDLWQGQKGTKDEPKDLDPLIEVKEKQHLVDFLVNNFINKEGKSLSPSSFSDYLNTSEEKNSKRPLKNRIELKYK